MTRKIGRKIYVFYDVVWLSSYELHLKKAEFSVDAV